jgi:hypothetical protein
VIWGFLHPWLFSAAAAILALLLLYWWQRQAARHRVSALFLWPENALTRSGSRWLIHRLPGLFYLEAAALLLLVAAGASPFLCPPEQYPPLVVILDNSYSMQACRPGGLSPQQAALRHLEKLLSAQSGRRVLWILAGNRPRLLADGNDHSTFRQFWTASESRHSLAEALALGKELCPQGEFLLCSDRAPAFPLDEQSGCFAEAEPLPNVALVNARRTDKQLLLEIANYSSRSQNLELVVSSANLPEQLTLAAQERRKITFALPETAAPETLRISLSAEDDALDCDNQLTLLSEERPPVTCSIAANLPDICQRELLAAIAATPAWQSGNPAELHFGPATLPPCPGHRFLWHLPEQPGATDPQSLVAQPDHPLLRGLSLTDLRWCCVAEYSIPGTVLLWQDRTPVFSILERQDGAYDFHLHLLPQNSNISRQPFWPILFCNLAEFLQHSRPGPGKHNWRDHELISINLPPGETATPRAVNQDGQVSRGSIKGKKGYFEHLPAGAYTVHCGKRSWPLAVQACSSLESDLSQAGRCHSAARNPGRASGNALQSFSWLPAVLAAGILVWHHLCLKSRRNRR